MSVESNEKEQSILDAVAQFAFDRHSTISVLDVEKWNLDEEEYAHLQFDKDGYLLVSVEDVYIEEVQIEYGVKVYYVSVTINTGLDDSDADVYSCYQGEDGEFAIEWDHS